MRRESPKQVPISESPTKREQRMSPSTGLVSLQQDRRSLDTSPSTQRDNTTGTPTSRENGIPLTGKNEPSSYEPAG